MAKLITRSAHPDGDLAWLQALWQNPVLRMFWINQVPGTLARGGHRHPSCQMALHCLMGSVNVYVQTPHQDLTYILDSPDKYLLLDPEDWRLMYNFSPETILMVLAEKPFKLTTNVDESYRPFSPILLQ